MKLLQLTTENPFNNKKSIVIPKFRKTSSPYPYEIINIEGNSVCITFLINILHFLFSLYNFDLSVSTGELFSKPKHFP